MLHLSNVSREIRRRVNLDRAFVHVVSSPEFPVLAAPFALGQAALHMQSLFPARLKKPVVDQSLPDDNSSYYM